jgi:glycosyltransferase involved in cell wall biosynthesis
MVQKKIALFHPWLKSRGGAEKVVLKLAQELDAKVDIYTWIYDKEKTFSEFKKLNVNLLAPKFAKKFSRMHILRGLFLIFSFFSKIPLEKYDKFIISTSGVGEFIVFRNYKPGKTYAYVHTPLREANKEIIKWNLKNRHKNIFSKLFYLIAVKIYRFFEKLAWKKIDHVIFNSEFSKQRAEQSRLLGKKKNSVVYPPIEIPKKLKIKKGNYFLYVSRINPPKRQRELVEAFNNFSKDYPHLRLILVGTPENKRYYKEIEKMIKNKKNIEIKSNLSDKEINNLYNNCLAGIFLGYQEDFGIVPLEIIGRGKPLFAVDEGGFVGVIKNNPFFHKIKEKHNKENMIKEIEMELRNFLKKDYSKKRKIKLKTKDFIKEIGKVLENE